MSRHITILFLVFVTVSLRAQQPASAPAQQPAPTPTPAPAQQPRLVLPIGHSGDIDDAIFSPDGRQIVTEDSRSVKVWQTDGGILLAELKVPDDFLTRPLFFSPDGKKLLTCTGSRTAIIWDAATYQPITRLQKYRPNYWPNGVFSPDGLRFIAGCARGRAYVWNTITGEPVDSVIDSRPTQQFYDRDNESQASVFCFQPGNRPLVLSQSFGKWELIGIAGIDTPVQLQGYQGWLEDQAFSGDGSRVQAICGDSTLRVWDARSGQVVWQYKDRDGYLRVSHFSPDGKRIATIGSDHLLAVWNTANGRVLWVIGARESGKATAVLFSRDNRRLFTTGADRTIRTWDLATGNPLTKSISPIPRMIYDGAFSTGRETFGLADVSDRAVVNPNGATALVFNPQQSDTIAIFNTETGDPLAILKGHTRSWKNAQFDKSGDVFLLSGGRSSTLWDAASGKPVFQTDNNAVLSPDGSKILTTTKSAATIWDWRSGKPLSAFAFPAGTTIPFTFTPDGRQLLAVIKDSIIIWDAGTGKRRTWPSHETKVAEHFEFDSGGSRILVQFLDGDIVLYEKASGRLLAKRPGFYRGHCQFSPDGRSVLAYSDYDTTIGMWDGATTKTVAHWDPGSGSMLVNEFGPAHRFISLSPDGTIAVIRCWDDYKIWNIPNQRLVATLPYHHDFLTNDIESVFSPDSKTIAIARTNQVQLIDVATGICRATLTGHGDYISSLTYSPDGRSILTTSEDYTTKCWNAATGRLLYTLIGIDSTDYLAVDADSRFDGTDNARKLLYLTCGTEIIALDQLKDQIWVPNLIRRIHQGDSIAAPRLAALPVCGIIPLVTRDEDNDSLYRFRIIPRAGGLGTVVLSVNGNQTLRFQRGDLRPMAVGYELSIPKSQLASMLISGQPNPITVKAYTADNELFSRGASVITRPPGDARPPNLYAVMVGVSDYKGEGLDLKYAAKDATDLSHAVEAAAKKWLGNDHVFMYNLVTDPNHYRQPEKAAIRQTLEAIGKTAAANDILLIFFAGHGVMAGEPRQQFYFLTADASPSTIAGSALADVSISARELTDWIQPANIKAQKRILILDACNSGQAINDIVQVGEKDLHYAAARNDDNAEQTRSIDKLNEQSGLFILAASASNQSAYEMSRYSQGLLTYALLKAIKEDPGVLDNEKYLNIAPWFDHAKTTVSRLVTENGARQEPQVISTTNFDIGIVDTEVTSSIRLATKSTLFASATFTDRNESAGGDDLDLSTAIDQRLNTVATRGAGPDIAYIPATMAPDAWSLSGSYTVTGDTITVTVNLWHNKKNQFHFPITGPSTHLDDLATRIVDQALEWINKHA